MTTPASTEKTTASGGFPSEVPASANVTPLKVHRRDVSALTTDGVDDYDNLDVTTRATNTYTRPASKPPTSPPLPPPPLRHRRDVSALTTDGVDDNNDPGLTTRATNTYTRPASKPPISPPAPPPPLRHRRGISADLTRRPTLPRKAAAAAGGGPVPEPALASRTRVASRTAPKQSIMGAAKKLDAKVVGLGGGARYSAVHKPKGLGSSIRGAMNRSGLRAPANSLRAKSIEEEEEIVRRKAESNPVKLLVIGGIAAVKVFAVYLITLDTILSCVFSVGLTFYWYFTYRYDTSWNGGTMDWVLLGFAVVTPISMAVGIAFRRRERALMDISRIRSFAFQIYLAHALWDWGKPPHAGRQSTDVDWLQHTDLVLQQLVGIGDELCRFLTLPTYSRTRHRMMRSGRIEAARTVEVAYRLFDSLYTQRIMKLTMLAEAIKAEGLNHSEVSRIRQYERFVGESIEDLRVIKTYRTPQALRSFGRIFTVVLPPFYAAAFAQLAMDVHSLGLGICFALITPICLTALFESIQVLEDPFVAFITLDGIDAREEFEVLHWQQLVNARKILFPYAPPFPAGGQEPVVWEVVTEEAALDTTKEPLSQHSTSMASDVTDVAGTATGDVALDMEDVEMGYSSDGGSSAQSIRTSNFAVLSENAPWGLPGPPGSIGSSWRSMRTRLPSVESVGK